MSERVWKCDMLADMLGYLITVHGYGTWLHGHPDGSVDSDHNRIGDERLAPDPARWRREREQLSGPPKTFGPEERWVIDATVREVCVFRRWILTAVHPRTTHTHIIATAPGVAPEKIMNDCKAYCTRRLVETGLVARGSHVWSHHGSTRYLDTDESFNRAVKYVLEEQGAPLPMIRPRGWTRGEPAGRG